MIWSLQPEKTFSPIYVAFDGIEMLKIDERINAYSSIASSFESTIISICYKKMDFLRELFKRLQKDCNNNNILIKFRNKLAKLKAFYLFFINFWEKIVKIHAIQKETSYEIKIHSIFINFRMKN